MVEGPLPLEGVLVLDCTRMLPGAVLARTLLDLGARVVKVEDPVSGESMRLSPPPVDGMGAGFSAFYRGAESVCLDLRAAGGARALLAMARRADVLVESFRPGTMERWGLGQRELRKENDRLVYVSLSGFGTEGPHAARVAHDMNLTAASGLYDLVRPAEGIPRAQLADVTTALLAASAVLAALLRRERVGGGAFIDQPLASGMLPHLTWAWADAAAGGGGIIDTVLAGRAPAYRTYPCRDGGVLAVGALEPKFWVGFLEVVGRTDLAGAGLDTGAAGQAAAEAVIEALATRSRDEWLALCEAKGLPVTPVRTVDEAVRSRHYAELGLAVEEGSSAPLPGPYIPSLGRRPSAPPPRHGEHTEKVLDELARDER